MPNQSWRFLAKYAVLFALLLTAYLTIKRQTAADVHEQPLNLFENSKRDKRLKVIVLTFSRAKSLAVLLESLDGLELNGDQGSLEIWIDRDKDEKVDKEVFEIAKKFIWKKGMTSVHVQSKHVGIFGQWIDSWRPDLGNEKYDELALILEDDMTVSPYAYLWLRAVHAKYGWRRDFAGASLNGGRQMRAHNNDRKIGTGKTAFMYVCIGTWGFSPSARLWAKFRDWFHANQSQGINSRTSFHPYVEGARPTEWYKVMEETNRTDTMWEMWFIFFADQCRAFTVYGNLRNPKVPTVQPDPDPDSDTVCLAYNRQEAGLHFDGSDSSKLPKCNLVTEWHSGYVDLPEDLEKYDWNGDRIE